MPRGRGAGVSWETRWRRISGIVDQGDPRYQGAKEGRPTEAVKARIRRDERKLSAFIDSNAGEVRRYRPKSASKLIAARRVVEPRFPSQRSQFARIPMRVALIPTPNPRAVKRVDVRNGVLILERHAGGRRRIERRVQLTARQRLQMVSDPEKFIRRALRGSGPNARLRFETISGRPVGASGRFPLTYSASQAEGMLGLLIASYEDELVEAESFIDGITIIDSA